ncbi:restriction endonuclease subunit S [Dialister succinatiphilus]|uniref:restriction endonuclease subunit S n=1 Tax=Dialister succinatiphilus TaxID=487173 RepID=UPI002354EB0F|nr:restriction endonuclease subunit S [Dialister succinatiphilus]MCI6030289.1 restriction endonuclease subunit S [Dialister succinatiphilus]
MKNIVNLGNVATYINGYAFKPSDWAEDGAPIIRIQDLTGNSYQMNRFKGIVDSKYDVNSGDVLISWSASLGVYVWNRGNAVLNQHIFKVVFDKEEVDKDFFVFQIDNLLKRAANQAHGATMRHLTKPVFDALPFYLPDIKTQRLISSKLNLIVHLIEDHHEQLKKLDELIRSRFVELFGNPVMNQKRFPVKQVGDVIDFIGGSQPPKNVFEYTPTEENIRLIQIRDYRTDKYKTYIPRKLAKRFCTADDIMIGRYGPPIFQILGGIEGSYNVALMKAVPKMGNREFIRWFLKQECLLHYLEGMSKRTAGQDGIQMDKLKKYPFPYPPIELQNQFANFAKQLDKSKLAVQKSLDELEILKKSLMQQYFG